MQISRQRRTNVARKGFTLVELVVVILVLGIIAAIAAPKMFDTANDASENSSRQSLSVVRDAIELFRAQNGAYPAVATIVADLGPFLNGPFPAPQQGANQNPTFITSTENPIVSVESGTDGYVYNATTGEICINDATLISW